MATALREERNLLCRRADLTNEAAVERCFIERLIQRLGYEDHQVCPKTSLQEIAVGQARGRRESLYKPDFAIKIGFRVRWIIEAKPPSEDIDEWLYQPRQYTSFLNGQYPTGVNPVELFLITNGELTKVFRSDHNDPILTLTFSDFNVSNRKFNRLIEQLSPSSFRDQRAEEIVEHTLVRPTIEQVNAIFARCHQYIHVKEGLSQQAAFMEFVKVVFLKLLSDKTIRQAYPEALSEAALVVPADEVRFSLRWIESRETDATNPLSSIQFRRWIEGMEADIMAGHRKRVFDADEIIDLKAQTINYIVSRLQGIYLFGIDADLNGRLFETFLNATMRGKDLGQFFTPRSVVRLGTKLAMIKVHVIDRSGRPHTDTVVDACCGSGGFLIEALADMWRKIEDNSSLSDDEKHSMRRQVANDHILGVDFGKEPPLARIARLNMYLHGDGGARIFQADALDKSIQIYENDDAEIGAEKRELRRLFATPFADVILTNPPFAKTYDRDSPQELRVLNEYGLSSFPTDNEATLRQTLRSSVMFVERYHDIMKPGGTLVTVLDDSLLGGREYRWFRSFMRERFFVRAVVSLPGDAFQRSNARVKTSLVVLQKRNEGEASAQPSAFMYASRYIGIDDPARQRTLSIDHETRRLAVEEVAAVEREYRLFLEGRGNPDFVVSGDRLMDRLDVKSCMYAPGRNIASWERQGLQLQTVADWLDLVTFADEDVILTSECTETVGLIHVTYDGRIEATRILASDCKYKKLYRIAENDIVISRINAVHGAIGIVPPELEDGVVTPTEYRVMRAKEGVDARLVWMLLRSYEARAEFLLTATGIGRTRVEWESLAGLQLPVPGDAVAHHVTGQLGDAVRLEREAARLRADAERQLQDALDLNNQEAFSIVEAFKPPR